MKDKIAIISSCGGHLTEIRALRPLYGSRDHFYVLNDRIAIPDDMQGKTYFIHHSERDWKFMLNLWEAWRILKKERPKLLISTGAGPIVPFALVGKLLGIPCLYIEIGTQIETPSLTGRVMYRLADRFFYQWPALQRYFPKGVYGGTLL